MVAEGECLVDVLFLHVVVYFVLWPVAAMHQQILPSKPIWMEIEYSLQDIDGLKFRSVTKRAGMICINGCSKCEIIGDLVYHLVP